MMRPFKNIWPKIPVEKQAWRLLKKPDQRLCIEIGAGVGLHPIQFTQDNLDAFLVAIERTKDKAEKMLRRAEHHPEINNLYAVHADAIQWICEHIQKQEVSEYFILYPNPYPKAAQANKRFMYMPVMKYLIEALKPGGAITLATNIESYYEEAKRVFQNEWGLILLEDELVSPDAKPRTHFEKKYLARGERCFHLKFGC